MVGKTVPLSVRVSDEDAAFLAALEVEGAITPSEKLRALLTEARRRQSGRTNYDEALGLFEEAFAPALKALRSHELSAPARSELMHLVAGWLPEVCAFLASALRTDDAQKENDSWLGVEAGVADRIFALMQGMLRMGVTPACAGYDPHVISKRLGPMLDLAEAVRKARS